MICWLKKTSKVLICIFWGRMCIGLYTNWMRFVPTKPPE